MRKTGRRKKTSSHKERAVSNRRYQTSRPSLSVISLPKTPVSPARRTAICSWMNAFFKLFTFSHNFLGKSMHGRRHFVLYTITVIFEQGLPAQIQYAEDAFLYNTLIHFGDAVFTVFKDDGNFFYGKAQLPGGKFHFDLEGIA